LIIFYSCTSNGVKTQQSDTIAATDSSGGSQEVYGFSHAVLSEDFTDTIYHIFSDPQQNDRFTFYIPKGKINETKAILTIQTAHGDIIFADTFETRALVHDEENKVKTDEQMIAHILLQAKEVLGRSSFHELKENDGLLTQSDTTEYPDYNVTLECKDEKRPLFVLSLWDEDITYYGYSLKKRKVLPVFWCC
jgi:hypothetical protein